MATTTPASAPASGDTPTPMFKPSPKPSPLARARAAAGAQATRASAALTTARGHVGRAATHPHAQRAFAVADRQIANLREVLGRSEMVVAAEQRTGVDRVKLVAAGTVLFIVLIPFNLFGLAQTTTTALTVLFPAYHALLALERGAPTTNLLAYFVILGYLQVLETFMLRLLVSQIPRYYTLKLAATFYLAHPRLNGATQVYNLLFARLPTPSASPVLSPPQETIMTPPSNGTGTGAMEVLVGPTSPSPARNVNKPEVLGLGLDEGGSRIPVRPKIESWQV